MIVRKIAEIIKDSAHNYPIVGIVGPRQSGKTTLVQSVFPDYKYVNLETPDLRRFAQEDPRGFLDQYSENVIFDEVQRVPELLSYLQVYVDDHKGNGRFILTGSQHFLLMESIGQSLAGRIALHTLLPLSLEEVGEHKISELILKGGYPKLHDSDISPSQWYGNYIQTYLDRDIRTLSKVGDLTTFENFIRLCAGRTGQELNLSSLATHAGISHNTAKSWISLLKTSFIVNTIEPFYKNFNKRLVKSPKMFFVDTGLACKLLGIDTVEQLKTHPAYGFIFESFVIGEYFKYCYNRREDPRAYFWRDKSGREVDLIIEKSLKIVPIEIKSSATVDGEFFENLNYFLGFSSLDRGILVYAGENEQTREKISVVPVTEINSLFRIKT
ncbi:MAG: ATP-binding protein [Patescibacteria group bacterium]